MSEPPRRWFAQRPTGGSGPSVVVTSGVDTRLEYVKCLESTLRGEEVQDAMEPGREGGVTLSIMRR